MDESFWVFGYGSLIWKPGFLPAERHIAHLPGYRRSFCMQSVTYRGSQHAPGLVLALQRDATATCAGVALRVAPDGAKATLDYLRERELTYSGYQERHLPITLADGRSPQALAYVIDCTHPQFCGGLTLGNQAQIIARSRGEMGENSAYLFETAQTLASLGLQDPDLSWLAQRVAELTGKPSNC